MFAAIEETLGRLYPTRRWDDRHDDAAADHPAATLGPALAERLASRLGALALHVPGGPEEYCDFVYVLCLGRTPSLIELREGRAPAALADGPLEELYLRVALSALAPFAAVQQVTMRTHVPGPVPGPVGDGLVLIEEVPRTGVFDPVLLPRLRTLVAVLAELEVRN